MTVSHLWANRTFDKNTQNGCKIDDKREHERIRPEWRIEHIILSSLDLATSTLLNGVATQWCGKNTKRPCRMRLIETRGKYADREGCMIDLSIRKTRIFHFPPKRDSSKIAHDALSFRECFL